MCAAFVKSNISTCFKAPSSEKWKCMSSLTKSTAEANSHFLWAIQTLLLTVGSKFPLKPVDIRTAMLRILGICTWSLQATGFHVFLNEFLICSRLKISLKMPLSAQTASKKDKYLWVIWCFLFFGFPLMTYSNSYPTKTPTEEGVCSVSHE